MKETFLAIIKSYPEEIQALALKTRELLYTILPKLTEVVWENQGISGYGTGPKKMSQHFCWIKPAKKHITLGFNYGAELPDPSGLLEGTGKMFRHVKIKSLQNLESNDLKNLITFATTHRVPPIKE